MTVQFSFAGAEDGFPASVPTSPTWHILDSTKLKCAQECWRKFFYEYLLGWRPEGANNHLVFGSAIHEALEDLYLNGFDDHAAMRAHIKFTEVYRAEFGPDTDELFAPKTPENALYLLEEYVAEYRDDLRRYEVEATEIGGTIPVAPDRVLHFKMDTLLRERESGRHFCLEHKTKGGSFSRPWNDQWLLSLQTGTYSHVLHSLYPDEEPLRVVVNGLGMLKTKRAFLRIPVEYGVSQMRVWLWNVNHLIDLYEHYMQLLLEANESNAVLQTFPMNTQSCTKYFGCPYADFCYTWSNPLRRCYEPPLGFRIEHWNPAEIVIKKEVHLERPVVE